MQDTKQELIIKNQKEISDMHERRGESDAIAKKAVIKADETLTNIAKAEDMLDQEISNKESICLEGHNRDNICSLSGGRTEDTMNKVDQEDTKESMNRAKHLLAVEGNPTGVVEGGMLKIQGAKNSQVKHKD